MEIKKKKKDKPTPMTSIFEGQPLKTRPFPSKTRVIWVYINKTGSWKHLSQPTEFVGHSCVNIHFGYISRLADVW